MENILITICARGGSKGIPGKNIKMLNGRPLIDYSIKHANAFAEQYSNVDIALSTDSQEIIDVSRLCGLYSDYLRPDYLANDIIGKMNVLKHILYHQEEKTGKNYDILLDLDVTSPLRTIHDLKSAYEKFKIHEEALNIFSVSKPHKNPYFNIVEKKRNNYYGLVKQGDSKSRQTAPIVYDMNASFYFYRKEFFNLNLDSAITEKSLIYLMQHTCFDLDEPLDFEIMEFLISTGKLDFVL